MPDELEPAKLAELAAAGPPVTIAGPPETLSSGPEPLPEPPAGQQPPARIEPRGDATENGDEGEDDADEEMPRVQITRRNMLIFGIFVASAIGFLYFVLPQITGLGDTWKRIETGDGWWLLAAAAFEVLSFGGYILLFRTVFVRGDTRIDWRESYQITMAGLAATRLFAAAGAGGIALTAWAVRRSGMRRRTVACRMIALLTLLYGFYMGCLVVFGFGLDAGIFDGEAPFGFTVVPAMFGLLVITICLLIAALPADFERRLDAWAHGTGRPRLRQWARRFATVPASMATGVRTALRLIRDREWGTLGAPAWWIFDMAVLWASFHAFGEPPPVAVLVMGYFVGMLANALPLPGGIGGVEGGMIASFLAFGVDGGLAVVAVLTYRAFAFWLPTIPGVIAYLQLRQTVARWKVERPSPEAAALEVNA